jgi:hypothetical protein
VDKHEITNEILSLHRAVAESIGNLLSGHTKEERTVLACELRQQIYHELIFAFDKEEDNDS